MRKTLAEIEASMAAVARDIDREYARHGFSDENIRLNEAYDMILLEYETAYRCKNSRMQRTASFCCQWAMIPKKSKKITKRNSCI